MSVKNLERRFDMCSFILEARVTHYDSLMEEFNISKSTAIRDVRFISDYLLALDTQPGCAGYIKVLDSAAQSSLIKLNQNDATVLIRLYKAISEYDYETIVDEQERMLFVLHKLMTLHISPGQLKDVS